MRKLLFLILITMGWTMRAQNQQSSQPDIHPRLKIQNLHNDEFQPRSGGLCLGEDGEVYVSTWTTAGSVFRHSGKVGDTSVVRVAAGLSEPLGLHFFDGDMYVAQRQELTRLRDTDQDGIFDLYETVYDDWPQTGNFHEVAFGLPRWGDAFLVGLAVPTTPAGVTIAGEGRGQILKISMQGEATVFASGLNTPSGMSVGMDDQLLVTDQLGAKTKAARLLLLKEGDDAGYQDSLLTDEALKPFLWLPRNAIFEKPGQALLLKQGPYAGQILIGDVVGGTMARVSHETVNGQRQGCLYRFSKGFDAGIFRLVEAPSGNVFLGGLDGNGNWGFPRSRRIALHRLEWQEAEAFEIEQISARQNGFVLTFSEGIAPAAQDSLLGLQLTQWRYDEKVRVQDEEPIELDSLHLSADRKQLFVETSDHQAGRVVHLRFVSSLVSEKGNLLLTEDAWYTLNEIPDTKGPN